MNRLLFANLFRMLIDSNLHTSACLGSSVFAKKQKRLDPEMAKIREQRRRRKLAKEIREMQQHSKKPKPLDEMSLDLKSAGNIQERIRPLEQLSVEQEDHIELVKKAYSRLRLDDSNRDDRYIRAAIKLQKQALIELKAVSEHLYAQAVQPDTSLLPFTLVGPPDTPPFDYEPPDGDYIDTTRSWADPTSSIIASK